MTAELISGTKISKDIKAELREEVAAFVEKHGFAPHITVILVGDNPASASYVGMKEKTAKKLGMGSETIRLPAETTEEELLDLLRKLNDDPAVHGILVQLPLPKHIDDKKVIETIDPIKDVDGFHPINVGRMLVGEKDVLLPCTPHGIQVMLVRSGVETSGAETVIVGRSNIVGKPMAAILVQKAEGANATVTIAHTRTKDMAEVCKRADILIVAAGVAEFVKGDMIKPGAVVIDVGSNRVEDASLEKGYKWVGDVAFDEAKEIASKISPVPGGVGPMTIAMLMTNTVKAARMQVGDE